MNLLHLFPIWHVSGSYTLNIPTGWAPDSSSLSWFLRGQIWDWFLLGTSWGWCLRVRFMGWFVWIWFLRLFPKGRSWGWLRVNHILSNYLCNVYWHNMYSQLCLFSNTWYFEATLYSLWHSYLVLCARVWSDWKNNGWYFNRIMTPWQAFKHEEVMTIDRLQNHPVNGKYDHHLH